MEEEGWGGLERLKELKGQEGSSEKKVEGSVRETWVLAAELCWGPALHRGQKEVAH